MLTFEVGLPSVKEVVSKSEYPWAAVEAEFKTLTDGKTVKIAVKRRETDSDSQFKHRVMAAVGNRNKANEEAGRPERYFWVMAKDKQSASIEIEVGAAKKKEAA